MNSQRFFRFIVLSAVLVLISSGLFFAGDPVPGLDVSLEQIPGGKIQRGTTNSSGVVTFNNLKPGDYRITFVNRKKSNSSNTPSYKKSQGGTEPLSVDYNSSRSNVKLISPAGKTECEVDITLIYGSGPKTPDVPIEVTIGPNGGTIKIRFDREVLPAAQ